MKTNYIIIENRGIGDRLGAQLTWYICQLIYAHYHSYYIEYNEELYPNSIFTLALKKYINEYNKNKIKNELIKFIDSDNWCNLNSKLVTIIKSDLISYFKQHLFKIRNFIDEYALSRKYSITFNPRETILIHLRLDDVNFDNRIDYDGSFSFNFYANKINNNNFDYSDETQYYLNNSIVKDHNLYNAQSPISDDKIESIINKIKLKYKNHKVLIITSPIGKVTLNYPIIRSIDPSLDLFYLCNCDIVILSRSTFALSTLYLSRAKEYWIPTWGYVSSLGLETEFSNIKFNYFN
jgi:hypothetical protein